MPSTSLLNNLDWNFLLERLCQYASSSQAQEDLRATDALPNIGQAKVSFKTIEECKSVLKSGVRPSMESLDLFLSWFPLVEKNSHLNPLQLKDIRFFLIEYFSLKETLSQFVSPILQEHLLTFFSPEEGLNKIENLITNDGLIRSDASQTLHELNKKKKDLSSSIQKTLDKLVKSYEIEDIIQDKYVTTREGRWVLPIKSGMQHRFEGIIHDSSQSKQTVFMEPSEVVKTNNTIREIELDIKKEIERLLLEISNYFYALSSDLSSASKSLLFFDIYFSKAQLALKTNAHECQFTKDQVNLLSLKNPILLLQDEKVVSNSVTLNSNQRILLLSGPNAGGKTVLLKSIGLAIHMARCGLLVCASPESELPFVNHIVSSVGDHQSVSQNLSSFASHLKILEQATHLKGSDSLVLVDEICSSTDPEEGSALARSFIDIYCKNNVFAVITSHFSHLKNHWPDNGPVINGSLEFDLEKGPTYQFLQGISGDSLAIQTAKRIGISPEIIDRALDYISPDKKEYIQSIDEVTELKNSLKLRTLEANEAKKSFEKQLTKYKNIIARHEKEKELMLEKSVIRAERKIEKLIRVNKAGDVLSKNSELQKVKSQLPEIVKPNLQPENNTPQTVAEFAQKFPPGSKVFITSLKKEGLVQSSPNNKGLVDVVSQSMRLQLDWKLLQLNTANLENPTQQVLKSKGFYKLSQIDGQNSIDLRGMSVDEAISKIEIELDKATVQGLDRVKVIHGHGTNSLKRATRSYLSRCLYVKNWSSGNKNQGGDGVTWVELKDPSL